MQEALSTLFHIYTRHIKFHIRTCMLNVINLKELILICCDLLQIKQQGTALLEIQVFIYSALSHINILGSTV